MLGGASARTGPRGENQREIGPGRSRLAFRDLAHWLATGRAAPGRSSRRCPNPRIS
jgi:hypothetical protein